MLVEAPVLPFSLDTDASDVGLRAWTVSGHLRSFSHREWNYCVTQRELLAVILAIRNFGAPTSPEDGSCCAPMMLYLPGC